MPEPFDIKRFCVGPKSQTANTADSAEPTTVIEFVKPFTERQFLLLRLAGLDALSHALDGNWAACRMVLAAVRRATATAPYSNHATHVSAAGRAWAALGLSTKQGRTAIDKLCAVPALVHVGRTDASGWRQVAALPGATALLVHDGANAARRADPEGNAFLPVKLAGLDEFARGVGHNSAAVRIGLRAVRRAVLPGQWSLELPLTAQLRADMEVSRQELRTALAWLRKSGLFEIRQPPRMAATVAARGAALSLLHWGRSPTQK